MSIARHHAEWLSLLEISGPFLSMPVLVDVFPQGLEADDPDLRADLRAVYEEWLDDQGGLSPDPRIHRAWMQWVFQRVLDFEDDSLWWKPAGDLPDAWPRLVVPEQDEVVTPDLVIVEPPDPFSPQPGPRQPRMLVMILPWRASPEKPPPGSRWQASAASRMMMLLHASGVRLGLITNGEQWMLVDAPLNQTTGFISWYASLWLEEPLTLRAFRTLLSSHRFFSAAEDETLEALLARSAEDQQEVTDQLGLQARRAAEMLVRALDRANRDSGGVLLAGVSQETLYEAAVTVMMRLIFLMAAEERELLLLGDPIYDQHYAVSTLRGQLLELRQQQGDEVLERRYDAWYRLLATFRAVHGGINHDRLHLPAYGGSLFDPDRFPFLEGKSSRQNISSPANGGGREGAVVREIAIDNLTVLHMLDALQMLRVKVPGGGPAEARRLSFRALDVEQIGHVYENLLDHTVRRADTFVLGLKGAKDKEPEIPLDMLEARAADRKALVKFLKEATGRSPAALRNALKQAPDPEWQRLLRQACNYDEEAFHRILPFANLIRKDDYGRPVVIQPGSLYVTQGVARRASGSHYTPRTLTEPIVRHALEPLVYDGPAQGKPRDQWRLRSPQAILNLKVCDMAMGSGAFLAQACRYLSERLVEAVDESSRQGAENAKGEKPKEDFAPLATLREIPDPDDRLAYARRLVADRCLYGVDKNPMAVEMAKLSLWLVTLDKARPFTFLDHALKAGDSIIGADEDMLLRWVQTLPGPAMALYLEEMQKALDRARAKRQELASFLVSDIQDVEIKGMLLAEAEEAMAQVKLGADLLIGTYLLELSERERESLQARLLVKYMAGETQEDEDAQRALAAARQHNVFHWPFAFPEVFLSTNHPSSARGGSQEGAGPSTGSGRGFDAFIGNPPFIGGRRIRETLGDTYRQALYDLYPGSSGNADYCAFFFLRGFAHLRRGGTLGLIATNTIAQGDTRLTGLARIVQQGGTIYRARNDMPWPGQAAVVVDVIHIRKGPYQPPLVLDDREVKHISSRLDSAAVEGDPYRLAANAGKSHMGTNVVGMGFFLTPKEAQALIEKDPRNKDVLFPYLNGQDLNTHPEQKPSRWIINFFDWPLQRGAPGSWADADKRQRQEWKRSGIVPDDYPGPVAADYPDCLAIVRERVYEWRQGRKGRYARIWWQFGRRQERLYEAIAPLERVLVVAQTSRTLAFTFVPKGWVYSHKVIVFAFDLDAIFAILQSVFHELWAWQYSSTLKQDLSYTPSTAFLTFPFPNFQSPISNSLQSLGEAYHTHRAAIMRARWEGLTQTYNRFHDLDETAADIARLRELHVAMDEAVAAAYGWEDIVLDHGFHETKQGLRYTIAEPARRELLARLLELNHQRYAEEVAAGLHGEEGRKPKQSKTKSAADNGQMRLL